MTHVKLNKFIGRISSQPDSELIGLGYVKILSDLNLVGSGGNIFKPDPTVDRQKLDRIGTQSGLLAEGRGIGRLGLDGKPGTDLTGGHYCSESLALGVCFLYPCFSDLEFLQLVFFHTWNFFNLEFF